ncbi:uncharacterized protein [Salminus brasiliensis]|uniref:uncharacterized protein n=1 Tax=Salminus brasiliensis TaxID=930266 RepID=UPI003B82FB80
MSKLSLMIFTFVILTIILCNHSACSQRRPGNVLEEPWKCTLCTRKSLIRSGGKHWKCNLAGEECLCAKTSNGLIKRHCKNTRFFKVSTPL